MEWNNIILMHKNEQPLETPPHPAFDPYVTDKWQSYKQLYVLKTLLALKPGY